MVSLVDVHDGVDMVTHRRLYVLLLIGIGATASLWRRMPAGDLGDVVGGRSMLVGLAVGLIWDRGRSEKMGHAR
jgi:hypothetical protein